MSIEKEKMVGNEEDIKQRYLISQPIRFAIVDLIRKKGKKYIAEISKELNLNRKIVSYHLRSLEKENLVSSTLMRKNPAGGNPVLVRYIELTALAEKILKDHSF